MKKRILYVAPAIYPYLPESYISNLCRFLPQHIQEKENEIRTFMPRFGCINERKNLLHEVIRLSGQNIIIEETDHPLIIKVASLQAVRMQIYFIDSEDFFKRKQIFTDEEGNFFPDNDSRILFFAKGVIETIKKLGWTPDIVHCHGWISSLVPIFIKTCFNDHPVFQDALIISSFYNDYFEDNLSPSFANKLKLTGIPEEGLEHLQNPNYDTLVKMAIDYSDGVVFGHSDVKPTVAEYLKNNDRLCMHHPEEGDYVDAYDEFYEKLLLNKKN